MNNWFVVPGDWRKPEMERSFKLLRCPEDGFARIDPMPTTSILSEHYDIDQYYTHSQIDQAKTSATPFVFKIIGKLAHFADNGIMSMPDEVRKRLKLGGKVLDVGAGSGQTLMVLRDLGYDVVGIEPDANATSLKRDFPVPVHRGTGENIPADVLEQSFDLVILSHVLEHTTDPIKVMSNMRNLLKPDGQLLVEVPNTSCLDFRLSRLNWQHLGVPRHLIFWTSQSLTEAVQKVGFVRTEVLYRHYVRQLSWAWVVFGKPMIEFYRQKGAYRFSIKRFSHIYYTFLFAVTVFLPAHLKYDSVVIVARRNIEDC